MLSHCTRFILQADSRSPRCIQFLNCSSHFWVHSIALDLSTIMLPLIQAVHRPAFGLSGHGVLTGWYSRSYTAPFSSGRRIHALCCSCMLWISPHICWNKNNLLICHPFEHLIMNSLNNRKSLVIQHLSHIWKINHHFTDCNLMKAEGQAFN